MSEQRNIADIKVAIVDDDVRLRSLLQMVIDESEGFSCPNTYSSCDDVLYSFLETSPDVILMDLDMPKINGIECMNKIKIFNPGVSFIMLTGKEEGRFIFQALCAGASGFLLKGLPLDQLLLAIEEVHRGGAYINSKAAEMIKAHLSERTISSMTQREWEIIELLSNQETIHTVANNFKINQFTVKQHIRNIYKKLEISTQMHQL